MAGPVASKRPKLSLQTKPVVSAQGRSRRSALAHADPKSPTTFNTLSNVYVTAIERSTPVQSTPLTAINTTQQQPPLMLQTDAGALKGQHQFRLQSPFAVTAFPDTPLSPNPMSPATAQQQPMEIVFPSQQMAATPPLSAGATEPAGTKPFSFANADTTTKSATTTATPLSPAQARRRAIYGAFGSFAQKAAPYSHNRALHSILRNSPLPPAPRSVSGGSSNSNNAQSPQSPRRQSRRLQEKAARRVGYESPLTQTITTEKYTKSHIDLLAEEASPYTPSPVGTDSDMMLTLDLAMAYSGDETRDGGQTPGPFEEMRRRMTSLGTAENSSTPAVLSPRPDGGVRKRSSSKRKEKRRKWVWTIGNQEDEDNAKDGSEVAAVEEESGAMRAIGGATASYSSPAPVSTSRTTTTVPMLRPPRPRPGKAINIRTDSSRKPEGTPEPVTAVQVSVEPHLLLPPVPAPDPAAPAAAEDRMDVEMSFSSDVGDNCSNSSRPSTSSSRATTPPCSMELDVVTPTIEDSGKGSTAAAPIKAEMALSGSATTTYLTNPDTVTRRDTPIPPDLVAEGQA